MPGQAGSDEFVMMIPNNKVGKGFYVKNAWLFSEILSFLDLFCFVLLWLDGLSPSSSGWPYNW